MNQSDTIIPDIDLSPSCIFAEKKHGQQENSGFRCNILNKKFALNSFSQKWVNSKIDWKKIEKLLHEISDILPFFSVQARDVIYIKLNKQLEITLISDILLIETDNKIKSIFIFNSKWQLFKEGLFKRKHYDHSHVFTRNFFVIEKV